MRAARLIAALLAAGLMVSPAVAAPGAAANPAPLPAAQQDAGERPELALRVAADPELEARATRLAAELRCPVCQGLSIQDSPSPLALQMKDLIRTQVGEGRSDEEIRGYFVSRYGQWVLLEPQPRGFNLLVYVLPALALVSGLILLLLAIRRWTVPAGEQGTRPADG